MKKEIDEINILKGIGITAVHPFFLAIVPYILMANFKIKNVYSNPFWLLVIYIAILTIIYFYDKKITNNDITQC